MTKKSGLSNILMKMNSTLITFVSKTKPILKMMLLLSEVSIHSYFNLIVHILFCYKKLGDLFPSILFHGNIFVNTLSE